MSKKQMSTAEFHRIVKDAERVKLHNRISDFLDDYDHEKNIDFGLLNDYFDDACKLLADLQEFLTEFSIKGE